VDRYFDSLKKIGVFNDGLGCDFTLEDGLDINRTENLPTEYNVLVLGATYYTKRIPDQKSIEIINLSKIPVVLIGGKDVSLLGTKLASQFDRDKCINLCGKLSLQQSAAVMKTSKRVITADTGMMHIAAALRCNIDVIWGNTTPDFGMYPYLPKEMSDHYHNHEVLGLSCRPCSKLGTHYCPKRHFQCMNNQKISALFEEKLLGN
jgi:ADP-heptose:LPS heptosyltransferase